MQILAANVTKLGDKVYRYLEDHSSEYHAIMVGEHRVGKQGVADHRHRLAKMGLNSYWAPAVDTVAGSTSGGAAIFVDEGLRSTHLGWQQQEGDADHLSFSNLAPVVITVGDMSFLLIYAYFTVNVGIRGNMQLLADLASVVRLHRLPWVLAADWNASPEEVQQEAAAWLSFVDGHIVHTEGITCTAAARGSCIDFLVVQRAALPWVGLQVVGGVPWRPHLGLAITIRQPLRPEVVRRIKQPPAFALGPLSKKDRVEWLAKEGQSMEALWRLCALAAGRQRQRVGWHECKKCFAYIEKMTEAEELGFDYAKLVRTMELFHAARAGPGEDEQKKAWAGPSRAVGPQLELVEWGPVRGAGYSLPHVATDPLHKWWAVLTTRMDTLLKLRNGGRCQSAQGKCTLDAIKAMAAAAPVPDADLLQDQPGMQEWAGRLADLSDLEPKELCVWLQRARVMLKRVAGRCSYQHAKAFRDWQQAQLDDSHGRGVFGFIREAPRALQASKPGVWHPGW